MGKGDKKSKRGKIWLGTYGNSRRRKKAGGAAVTSTEAAEAKPKAKKAPRKKAKAE